LAHTPQRRLGIESGLIGAPRNGGQSKRETAARRCAERPCGVMGQPLRLAELEDRLLRLAPCRDVLDQERFAAGTALEAGLLPGEGGVGHGPGPVH